jgi:hypothetical protein
LKGFARCLERAGLSTTWALHELRRAAADALHEVTATSFSRSNSYATPTSERRAAS